VSIVSCPGSCEFEFQPADLTILRGQTVVWTNDSTAPHTVTSCTSSACDGVGPGSGSPMDSPTIFPGHTYSVEFSSDGTYVYYCEFHGYAIMHGMITVTG